MNLLTFELERINEADRAAARGNAGLALKILLAWGIQCSWCPRWFRPTLEQATWRAVHPRMPLLCEPCSWKQDEARSME